MKTNGEINFSQNQDLFLKCHLTFYKWKRKKKEKQSEGKKKWQKQRCGDMNVQRNGSQVVLLCPKPQHHIETYQKYKFPSQPRSQHSETLGAETSNLCINMILR